MSSLKKGEANNKMKQTACTKEPTGSIGRSNTKNIP